MLIGHKCFAAHNSGMPTALQAHDMRRKYSKKNPAAQSPGTTESHLNKKKSETLLGMDELS